MKTLLITILSVICLTSCTDYFTDFTDSKHFYVDPHLKIFVKRFYAEAEKRNILPGKDMTMVITTDLNTFNTGVEGRTYPNLREIKIDSGFVMSNLIQKYDQDSLAVEYVVFHEMGHLLLHREHVNDSHYSIMTPDDQWKTDFQTDPAKRKILIDELFKM